MSYVFMFLVCIQLDRYACFRSRQLLSRILKKYTQRVVMSYRQVDDSLN